MPLRWSSRTVTTVTVLAVASLAALYAIDPTRHMVTPPCPYLTLTGIACPGCGLTRCLHFLLRGDLARAFDYNPWAFVIAPAAAAFALLPAVADEVRTLRVRTGISWVMLGLTLAFWVWRNTAAYPFMRV
jgi:Protein of unknown function (DUF2752)